MVKEIINPLDVNAADAEYAFKETVRLIEAEGFNVFKINLTAEEASPLELVQEFCPMENILVS